MAGVAPVVHGGSQEDGGEVVAPDQGSLDPGEEEDDDLPAAVLSDHLQEVLELDGGLAVVAVRVVGRDRLVGIFKC